MRGPGRRSQSCRHLADNAVARWAYAIRLSAGQVPLAVYRRGRGEPQRVGAAARILPSDPGAAQTRILELVGVTASEPSPGAREAGRHVPGPAVESLPGLTRELAR